MQESLTRMREANAGLFRTFRTDRDPIRLLEARTDLVDSAVQEAATAFLAPSLAKRFSLAACGGYGRRELFPYSDVDLLLLVKEEADLGSIKEPLSEFLRCLWDTGLRISHSVRTVSECCRLHEENIELHISLIDLRFLDGNQPLFEELTGRLTGFYYRYSGFLTRRLSDLARQRYLKFNNTVYHLEPNLKDIPGGIRDVHLLRWLAQLLPQQEAIRESIADLESAKQFLFTVRCFLHIQSGRDNNLLNFELQDEAARSLPLVPLAPEQWMRLYFQNARRVSQSSLRALELAESQDTSLFRQFRDRRNRLSSTEFTVSRDRVFLRNPAATVSSAESILRPFTFAARHGIRLSWDTQRRLRNEIPAAETIFRKHPPAWSAWRDLFAQPHASMALQEMQETGLLRAAIPEWSSIESLVVRDFYHRYTVDEHSLVAIQAIDDLVKPKPGTPPRFHELALEEHDLVSLRLALLLHDVGKGTKPGDHVRGSLETAAPVLQRMQAPEAERDSVLFLIEHHLDLSKIMNGRDLDDPATARLLTSEVFTQEDLRRLALLTYADISAVNPNAMTPWRLEQLWRVYSVGVKQLTRELATDRIHESQTTLDDDPVSAKLAEFLEGFPKRYLRTHTREQIEHHFALEHKIRRDGVAVEISRDPGAYLLTVLANDEPGLFASLCGTLASFGMNIVKAEAASNAAGCILDLIRFTDPLRTIELNPDELSRIQWTIECVVKHSIEVPDLLKRRRLVRQASAGAKIAPTVRFNNEASDNSTLIDFIGEDRPGLLYDLASAITCSGCNIEVVMIDTEAHKAIDVFYVTENGGKLSRSTEKRLSETLIRVAERTEPGILQ